MHSKPTIYKHEVLPSTNPPSLISILESGHRSFPYCRISLDMRMVKLDPTMRTAKLISLQPRDPKNYRSAEQSIVPTYLQPKVDGIRMILPLRPMKYHQYVQFPMFRPYLPIARAQQETIPNRCQPKKIK